MSRYAVHTQSVFSVGTTNDGMLISGSRDESLVRLNPQSPCEFCTCRCPPRIGTPSNCRCERCRFFRELWDSRALRIQQFFRNRKKARSRRIPRPLPVAVAQSPPKSPSPPPRARSASPPVEVDEPEKEEEMPAPSSEEPALLPEPVSLLPPLPRKRCGGGFSLVYPGSSKKLGSGSSQTALKPGSRSKSSGARSSGSAEKSNHAASTSALESAQGVAHAAASAGEKSCGIAMAAYPSSTQVKRSSMKLGSAAKLISSAKGSARTARMGANVNRRTID